MQPEKYIEDVESSIRRRKFFQLTASSIIFLASTWFLGPLVHEFAHIAVLKIINCSYSFEYGFQLLRGIYGGVNPYCQPEKAVLLLFYSAGYLATILTGGGLSAFSMRTDSRNLSLILAATGTGILVSILLSIGSKGDVSQIISLLELSRIHGTLTIVFVAVGIFITSLRAVEHIFRLERQE